MEKTILVRFGDLVLKGKNRNLFTKQIKNLLRDKLKKIDVSFEYDYNHILINYKEKDHDDLIKRLMYVTGLHSFSNIYKTTTNLDDISKLAVEVINKELTFPTTFKVESKRIDKSYPMTSIQISQEIAKRILPKLDDVVVDVKKPKDILNVEIRHNTTYIYLKKHKALGGFPIGIGGKGLVMLSGGIDSPVAAYLMMKQGIEVELFHFESTPLTPLESVQKVIEISKKLAPFMPKGKIKLHLVPFTEIHKNILKEVSDSYLITIMRRIMYQMAEMYANDKNILTLINGESVNQVASQTLDSIKVVEDVTKIPILRPVIAYDKDDIIEISKQIDTFDISIRPFNDCCSIYVPRKPVIHPTIEKSLFEESKFDFKPLIKESLLNIKTLIIDENSDLNILNLGFSLEDVFLNIKDNLNDN